MSGASVALADSASATYAPHMIVGALKLHLTKQVELFMWTQKRQQKMRVVSSCISSGQLFKAIPLDQGVNSLPGPTILTTGLLT